MSELILTLQTFLFSFLHLSLPLPPATVTFGLVGDLGLGRHITSTARTKNDFYWSFKEISPWLASHDFNLANLESPIITNCPTGKTGTFTFCGDQKFVPILSQNKLIFNLNNNHILNYGSSGLSQTKSLLQSPYFFDEPLIQEINGLKFGFIGFDLVTYPQTSQTEIIKKISTLAPQVDWLIVSIHWGNEYLPQPENWRITLAHQMIDAGADIIHGHHPHVWQGSENYQGKKIYYSLGNFIFDQSWSYETSHSKIIRLTVSSDQIVDEKVFPIEINFNSQPRLSISPTPVAVPSL